MTKETTAYIGLGSNQGERRSTIQQALDIIAHHPEVQLTKISQFIETDPVGGPPQGSYINAAAELHTTLSADDLLQFLHDIEDRFGRKRTVRWGPRTLDLDLLLYGSRIINTDDLVVPHPRMHTRRFVLEPLHEIAPEAVHPELNKSVQQLLRELE